MSTPPGTDAGGRSAFVDALRGFALIGICIVNLPFMVTPVSGAGGDLSAQDEAVQMLIALLFEGKFFVIFSLLFGFGFSVQLRRIEAGRATSASFLRRMTGLLVFGLAHAVLLFPGDILAGYAVLGGALWLMRNWSDRRLFVMAIAMTLLAAAMFAVLGGALLAADEGAASGWEAAAYAAYREGSFIDAAIFRLNELAFVAPFIVLFNWPLALAAFCLGLVAGRRGVLDDPARILAMLRPKLWLLLLGGIAGNVAFATTLDATGAWSIAAFAALAVGGPCLSALYVAGLAWAARTRIGGAVLKCLAPAGRMSLTNYLGQSLVANLIFMGWGGGLYGALGPAALFATALAIALALIAGSSLWLRVFRSGPDEWLLRSWTALKWQPFMR